MKICKETEAALQSRIASLIDLDKLLKQGNAALVAFAVSTVSLKKIIKLLEFAEKEAGILEES